MSIHFTDQMALPRINPNGHESSDSSSEEETLKTANAFKACAQFTAFTARVAVSPEASLFIQGIKMMGEPSGGGYLSGFNQGIGFLMLAASPVVELLRFGLGLPLAIGGALATAVTGVSYGSEWSLKQIGSGLKEVFKPSQASEQREKLTQKFVDRMHLVLQGLPYSQQYFYKQNPAALVNNALICVAFLSRDLKHNQLRVGENVLKKEDINKLDSTRKRYFTEVHDMKAAIQSLHLSPHDAHAWSDLTQSLKSLEQEQSQILSVMDQNRIETLNILVKMTCDLSSKIVKDEVFQRLWQKSIE